MSNPHSPSGRAKAGLIAGALALMVGAGATGAVVALAVDDDGREDRHKRMERAGGMRGMGPGGPPGRWGHGGPGVGGKGMGGGRFRGPGLGPVAGPRLLRRALTEELKIKDADLEKALLAAVDSSLEDGDITKDQAERIRAHIEEDGPFPPDPEK